MKYQRIDEHLIEIIPEGEATRDILMAVAKVSYDTAVPRGCGELQPYQTPSQEVILDKYIQEANGKPILLMDYINGRDCRTKVFKREGKWYLDAYAFQQRRVTSEEFFRGVVRDKAEDFLNKVIQELSKK